jgi:hypothetical protein
MMSVANAYAEFMFHMELSSKQSTKRFVGGCTWFIAIIAKCTKRILRR